MSDRRKTSLPTALAATDINTTAPLPNLFAEVKLKNIPFDPSKMIPNKFSERRPTASEYFIPIHLMCKDQKLAIAVWQGEDALNWISKMPLSVMASAEQETSTIPKIGQRFPTHQRAEKILAAWKDVHKTPQQALETIPIFVFGATITSTGIICNGDTILGVGDGAGRLTAVLEQFSDLQREGTPLTKHIIAQRETSFEFNFDLSGDPSKFLKRFLNHNRDAKRCSKGTTLSVEHGLLELINGDITLDNYSDELSRTYIVTELYKKPVTKSITELFPWSYEGRKSTHPKFLGKGTAASFVTALKDLANEISRTKIAVKDAPSILDFGLRLFYAESPTAVADSHEVKSNIDYRSRYKFHSTLACKVMVLLTMRVYAKSGSDKTGFVSLVNAILQKHYELYKAKYKNSKIKKMTIDCFWQETIYVGSAFNTHELLRDLNEVCNQILDD